jgi:hypothetical protein
LLPDDVWAEIAVTTGRVSLVTNALRQIENNRDRKAVKLPGERNKRFARLGVHVGSIDDGETAASETLPSDEVQDVECAVRRRLVVFVVRNQTAASVAREDLRGFEVASRERAFPSTGRADQDDE